MSLLEAANHALKALTDARDGFAALGFPDHATSLNEAIITLADSIASEEAERSARAKK